MLAAELDGGLLGEQLIADRGTTDPAGAVRALVEPAQRALHVGQLRLDLREDPNRYPKAERAYGFLIAKQLADDDLE